MNGAGKTTIIKLLCGLYRPDSGRILLNGVDVRDLRKEELYRLVAPVFQESVILPFTAAQNVSMRETEMDGERSGMWDAVCRLPQGMDSMLMNLEEDGGTAFSGGQQQKLLMARALYKDAMLLLFDEPTARLVPMASRRLRSIRSPRARRMRCSITCPVKRRQFLSHTGLPAPGSVTG